MSNNWLRTIFVFLVTATICGCGCNGDDPPQPPKPTGLVAIHGDLYRGEMGSASLNQPLVFAVTDNGGAYVPDQWMHFTLLEGDGAISADSLKTAGNGTATLYYTFDGSLGHAAIRAVARNLDTAYVYLRANTLIPGDHGQGQYVLLDDTYGDVVDFNGPPDSVEPYPQYAIAVANYESTMGVVVVIYDTDENGIIEPTSPVYGVLVVDSVFPQPPDSSTKSARYEGATRDSIKIGSSYWADINPVYGEYDSLKFADDPILPALVLYYGSVYLEFWCHPSDTTVYQISIFEEFDISLYESPPVRPAIDSVLGLVGRDF